MRSGTSRRRPPRSWSGKRDGSRPRCPTPGWRRTASVSWPGRWLRSSGGPAGWPVSTCRSATRCGSASACPWRRASRTTTARPTASWRRCCPGPGSVGDRLAGYRRRDAVPPDRLGPAVRALSAALRDRTAGWSGPAGTVEYRLVDGAPWSALQTYAGGQRSVVRVTPAPVSARVCRALVAHEAYPGHHAECVRGETAVGAGRVELGVTLLGSPQTVVSEGLAECGLGTAVGPGWGPWAAGVLASGGCVSRRRARRAARPRADRAAAGASRRRAAAARRRVADAARGSRLPRSTCSAGCCSTPRGPGAWSTPSPGRCGALRSSPRSAGRPPSGRCSSALPTVSPSTAGCSTPPVLPDALRSRTST